MPLPLLAGPIAQKTLEGMVGILSDWIKRRMDQRENQSIRDENLRFWKELAQETITPVSFQIQSVMKEMSRYAEMSAQAQISVARCLEMNCELQRAMTMMQVNTLLELTRAKRDSDSSDLVVKRQQYQFMLDNWPLRAEPSQIVEIYGRQLANENGLLLLLSVNADHTTVSEAQEEAARQFLEQKLDEVIFRYNLAAEKAAQTRGISRANVLYPSGIFQRHECGEWQARLFHKYLGAIPTLWFHVRLTPDGPELTMSWWGMNENQPNRRHISLQSLDLPQNLSQDDVSSLVATAILLTLDSLVLSERQGQIAVPLLALTEEVQMPFEQAYEYLAQSSLPRFKGLEFPSYELEPQDQDITSGVSQPLDDVVTHPSDVSLLEGTLEETYFAFDDFGFSIGRLLHTRGSAELFMVSAPGDSHHIAVVCFAVKGVLEAPEVAVIKISDMDESIHELVRWLEPCITVCFTEIRDRFAPIPDWNGPESVLTLLNSLESTKNHPSAVRPLTVDELRSLWLDHIVF